MKLVELLDYIFPSEVKTAYIFDDAGETAIELDGQYDEDQLILDMPDARIDLRDDQMVYAVTTNTIPEDTASLLLRHDDGSVVRVYLLEEAVDQTEVSLDWGIDIPVGLGWTCVEGTGQTYLLADLVAFQEDLEKDHDTSSETVPPVPVETPAEAGDDAVSEGDEAPLMMNDAEILGQDHPDMAEILAKSFTFMTGDLYGQRDRRNTQDGDWKAVTAPLINWMVGSEGKNGKGAWGLTRHPVGKEKGGPSIVPSFNLDGARKDAAVETMYAIVLDIDSGESLDETIDKLIEQGLFAIVYTTFSHGKTEVELKHDDIMRKLGLEDSPTRTQIQEYLRLHHSGRYDRDFIAQIEVVDARRQTTNGMLTVIKTPAIDKFRVVLPLWEPVKLADLAPTLQKWKDVWADAVTGVAVNMLDVNFDSSSTDVNRLFYTPRHPKGDDNWYSAVIQGRPLRFEEIKPYSKDKFLRQRTAPGDPFLADTDGSSGASDVPLCMAPSGMVLNEWHREAKDRFMIADVLETYCGDKLADADNKPGSVHIQCPFEHEHSSTGGSGTLAVNALDSDSEYWTVFCLHDSCKGRHKLEFLQQMLADEWFPESILKDSSFLLPPADTSEAPDEPDETDTPKTPVDEANEFNENSTEADVRKFIKRHIRKGIDLVDKGRVKTILANKTALSKSDINGLWRDIERDMTQQRATESEDNLEDFEGYPVVNLWDYGTMIEWGQRRIQARNATHPFLFHYMDGVARIRQNAAGNWGIRILSQAEFGTELNKITKWNHQTMMGDQVRTRAVAAPKDVVEHLYNDIDSSYPPLRAVVTAPIFTKEGEIIMERGYHDCGVYYEPDITLDIPKVSETPTEDEVAESVRLLVEEALADFPFGGLTRDEIVYQMLEGDGVPAVTHCLAMLLLFFCRDMIDGPTPGHLIGKPAPGTGASLLTDTCSIIATGQVTPAATMPTNPEEMGKTITALLASGTNMIFFDNINHGVDSADLASAMTAPSYKARILGRTELIDVEVRNIWTLTGNNVQLSSEILRRCVLIDLDAQSAEPEKRAGWRHGDIRAWVRDHRGKLIWACLTLIQNWVAQGMKSYDGEVLNSYENWSRVVGGIMHAANIGGFLGNRQELKAMAADGKENDIVLLIEDWWHDFMDKWVPTREHDEHDSLISMAIRNDIQLNIRKSKTADDNVTFNAGQFETFLTRYQNRVFILTDGTQVRIEKNPKKDKYGHTWRLKPMTPELESNVDV